jgi:hypothetical protein
MKSNRVIELDYHQVPLTIIFKGIKGVNKDYKLRLSADKCGILIN